MSKQQKTIAIAIPTYERENELIRLLKSIAAQQMVSENYVFEIVVVNNNPESYWSRVVKALPDSPFVMHCIDVQPRGFANVRNAAVLWVLDRNMDAMIFVDDDEVVPPGWLDAMMIAWEKYQGDIINGPVLQISPPSESFLVKKFHLLETAFNMFSGQKTEWANSNNTLVSRRVLEVMGPSFHPALNRSGGEDILYFHQCYLRGFDIYWDNSIMISEPTTPERATLAYVLKRRFNHGATRITINKILFSEQWRHKAMKQMQTLSIGVIKGLVASIIRRDYRRFGQVLCRLSWLSGFFLKLVGSDINTTVYH